MNTLLNLGGFIKFLDYFRKYDFSRTLLLKFNYCYLLWSLELTLAVVCAGKNPTVRCF